MLIIFATVIDLPLVPSELPQSDDQLKDILAIIKQERRLREASRLLMIQHKVPEEYRYFFEEWNYDYDPLILARIIEVESGWRERVIGPVNFDGSYDYGLAQLNSNYHDYFERRYWDRKDTFDVMNGHHSLFIAAEQLQMLYHRLDDEDNMIRAYNVGIGSVLHGWRTHSGNLYLEKVKNIW